MTGRLVLVRHGRTAWNRTRFLGRADVPLDDVGQAQARGVAEAVPALLLPDAPVTLWASPLLRARATAAPLAHRLGLPVRTHDALVELDCGAWEGREKAEVGRKVSKLPADEKVPGGESARDVAERLVRFLDDAALDIDAGLDDPDRGPARGSVVVVGHHLVNKVLHAMLLGRPLDGALAAPDYRPEPGSVVVLDRSGTTWCRLPDPQGALA